MNYVSMERIGAGILRTSLWRRLIVVMVGAGIFNNELPAQVELPYTTEFRLEDCEFLSHGTNPYWILEPGYELELEGTQDDGTLSRVEIAVLPRTKSILLPAIGSITTRVIRERHFEDDKLIEVSRNYFAICEKTNDVFYFGEFVNNFNDDGTVTHEGSWEAGRPDQDGLAQPGIIMPGTFLLGSRYFQEVADGFALDRAEHVEMGITITTKAGTFRQCVMIRETTPLEPGAESIKIYCPGVGLVKDGVAELVEFGFDD